MIGRYARRALLLFLLAFVLYTAWWIGRRSACRAAWRRGDVTIGEFLACVDGAPPWIARSSGHLPRSITRAPIWQIP